MKIIYYPGLIKFTGIFAEHYDLESLRFFQEGRCWKIKPTNKSILGIYKVF